MRISDWSSDVCSSDLAGSGRDQVRHLRNGAGSMSGKTISFGQALNAALDDAMADDGNVMILGEDVADEQGGGVFKVSKGLSSKYGTSRVRSTRSAEHTSELQSLMRISYAVLRLKKKKQR